jgi:hypothetical protein
MSKKPGYQCNSTFGYYREDVFTKQGKEWLETKLRNAQFKPGDTAYYAPGAENRSFLNCGNMRTLDEMGRPLEVVQVKNLLYEYNPMWNSRPYSAECSEIFEVPTKYHRNPVANRAFQVVINYYVQCTLSDGTVDYQVWTFHPFIIKDNLFVHPFNEEPIKDLADLDYSKYEVYSEHGSTFAMLVGDGKAEYQSVAWLESNLPDYDYDEDECEDCYNGNCDTCGYVQTRERIKQEAPVYGLRGTDASCWGNGMPVLRGVEDSFGKTPTHMILLLDRLSLWEAGNSPSDIMRFYEYMQKAGIIPTEGVKLLEEDDVGKSSTVFFSGIDEMSPEKMYFIFCCMRTPVQHPGIVRLTNKLIEDKDVDPLYAFLLAQITHPCFVGGHAVVNPGYLRYSNRITWEQRNANSLTQNAYPRLDAVVDFALRAIKLLDSDFNGKRRISKTRINNWELDTTLLKDCTQWRRSDSPGLSVRFSKDLKLTGENLVRLIPRERRIAV